MNGYLSWEIDLWGRIRRLIEASEADLRASVDDLRDALISVRAQTTVAYLALRTLEERLAVTEAAVRRATSAPSSAAATCPSRLASFHSRADAVGAFTLAAS